MTRDELLSLLKAMADDCGINPDRTHTRAEVALLAYIADPEITAAWKEAAEFWWYA